MAPQANKPIEIEEKGKMNPLPLKPVALQINIHLKKIQLSVPSPLKVKLMWVRGSKKLETKKKITIEPKNATTTITETMSLATKFHPDPNNPSQYKRKRCYLQIMATTKGQLKPVGILPFNLSEFVGISPQSTMKLTFAKCFDPKAAIFLSTSKQEIEQTNENLETESNATMETVSDTFSEYSSNMAFEKTMNVPKQSTSRTTDGTNLSSYVESDTRSASFISNTGHSSERSAPKARSKIELNKEQMQIQKLTSELSHYKSLLGEMTEQKNEIEEREKKQVDDFERQKGLLEEKCKHLNSIKLELKTQQEDIEAKELASHSERHKLKMKIDYLTTKCFQLNCKLDK